MNRLAQFYLISQIAAFWGYAVGYLGWPRQIAAQLGIGFSSLAGLADFRAMYGGMCLGIGVIYLLGIRPGRFREPALLLGVLTAGGLLFGRLWTTVADGPPGMMLYGMMAIEAGAVALGVWLLRSAPKT